MDEVQKPPEWLTAQEAADFLRVTVAAFYQRVYRDRIPSHRLGRSLRFKRTDLEALLIPDKS